MLLESGSRLGPYEVVAPLGAGGMGEVYRARDTRLDRDVALKVLPDHLSDDPKALARFEREAKAVAALSHPHILAIHDFGRIDGISFAVTELLEGEALRAVIERGRLPVRRALEIAAQVADALAAAHEKGIVHRDVKPENVIVSKEGNAKLLDFGLVRQTTLTSDPAFTNIPTGTALTREGVILGTVAYMSPELAQGLPADHRSDQFSLGIVLYEMLSGTRPFQRASAAETLTAIIREEPEPIEARVPTLPEPVGWLVDRLLSKEPHGRYDTTRDLARDLQRLSVRVPDAGDAPGSARSAGLGNRRRRNLPRLAVFRALAVFAVLLALAGALAVGPLLKGTARPPSPVMRTEIRLPEGHYLTNYRRPFALSPDGKILVFSAFTWKKPFEEKNPPQLFLRLLNTYEAKPIPGTEGGIQPFFSPDGRHVAFSVVSMRWTPLSVMESFLKRVPVAGGQVSTICKCEALFGAAWAPDGSILFASDTGPLLKVPDTGGTPEPATTLDGGEHEVSHRLPHLVADGRAVIYTALRWTTHQTTWKMARIFAQRLGGKERSLLAEGGSDGRWSPGTFLFAREGQLLGAPFDERSLLLTGKPFPILEGVRHSIWTGPTFMETGAAMLDSSGDQLLAWLPGSVTPEYEQSLLMLDPSGKETPLDPPRGAILGARISPDGARVLVQYNYPGRQLEVLELATGARRNLTFEMNPLWAIWGPGLDRITFTSYHEWPLKIYSRKVSAGPEKIETLWSGEGNAALGLGSWSRDGKVLAFVRIGGTTGSDIWLLEPGEEPRPLVASRFEESHPDISPDGRWLVYQSDEPGRQEVFARSLSGDSPPLQVSVGGGIAPLWSRDGSQILYWAPSDGGGERPRSLFRVRLKTGGEGLVPGRPERVLAIPCSLGSPGHSWDVGPDGRILIRKELDDVERRAWYGKILSDRIRVEVGGLQDLLAEAGKKP